MPVATLAAGLSAVLTSALPLASGRIAGRGVSSGGVPATSHLALEQGYPMLHKAVQETDSRRG